MFDIDFCYLNGPVFNPVLASTKNTRRQISIYCIFSLAGSLFNPTPLCACVWDIYNPKLGCVYAKCIKQLIAELGYPQGTSLVVGESERLDEISTEELTSHCRLSSEGDIVEGIISPEAFGPERHSLEHFKGSSPADNPKILEDGFAENRKRSDPVFYKCHLLPREHKRGELKAASWAPVPWQAPGGPQDGEEAPS